MSKRAASAEFGWVVGVDRVGHAEALRRRRRGPRRAGSERIAGVSMIEPGTFTVDPWSLTEPVLRLDLLGQDGIDLRAVERAHRAAREPG